ncbi:sensor histidine kinase [Paenibacillus cellulositrophicus]|uniref:cache domain-containing sensor histidine kinase n=1 Tax=Paenibacillus cellulositrophicus TaxID=562959 RepID=UPI00203F3FBD|nr:sensor histidine kinase [Paenibacillus cellulositrophicus]MCM3002295.1 sensor histidine kinase [Paenibacillus cellulositrophicus]
MNPFRMFRIDYVFFFSFAAFIAVLITIMMIVSYRFSANEQADSASMYQQAVLQQLNKQLTDQMSAVEQTSLAVAINSPLVNYLTMKGDYYARKTARDELNRDYLAPMLNSSRSMFSFQIYMSDPLQVDPNANIQYLPLAYASRESWYPAVDKADFVWIGQREVGSPQGKQQVISFIRKITTPDGVNRGILIINVRVKFLQDILTEDNSSASRLLLDSGGRMIMHTRIAPPPGEIDAILKEVSGDAGHAHQLLEAAGSLPEKNMLTVWSRTAPGSWMLVELTPWKDITGGSVRLAWTMAAIGAAAILLSVFFTLFLSRNFTVPIRKLVQLMQAFNPGKKGLPLPTEYRNEFGSLFSGYRKLTERIETLYQSLEQQYKAQREAEIKALQAMINPHFLYNTLDQLNWMALEAGQEEISRVLELMGQMFRIGLSGGESLIPMQDELLHVECYLKIQQFKRGQGLDWEIDCPEDLRQLLIPKLTLQPFVENAIVHGFHGRSHGRIVLNAVQEDRGIRIRIRDDGVGLRDDWKTRRRHPTGGYGIRNVTERIQVFFGPPFGVSLRNRTGGSGTEAEIYLPKLTQQPDLEGGRSDVDARDRG